MRKKVKNKKSNFSKAYLLLLIFAVLGIVYWSIKGGTYSKVMGSHTGQESPDVYILSVSETSQNSSRFKLRVTTAPEKVLIPASLKLTKLNGMKQDVKVIKTDSPYECYDSHDMDKTRLGFETVWVSGSLDDYMLNDVEVSLVTLSGNTNMNMPLSHVCTRFSEDIGEASDGSGFMFPYKE